VAGVALSVDNLPSVGGGSVRRLGLDQPATWWPTAPRLKAYEAAGFTYLQARLPPRALLAYDALVSVHARALRDALRLTGLRLILHAPDDLLAGSAEHDRQLDGALRYAAIAGAEVLVYHGARHPIASAGVRRRLVEEVQSLRPAVRRAERLDVRIAIENLAPVYPGPELVCHDPAAVHDLARRLDSDHAGICLDIGHAHIAAGLAACDLVDLVEPVLDRVFVFHVHDNFGADQGAPRAGGLEPLRLDLHLAPGAGSVPWDTLAPLLTPHWAPLQLEIHPAQRPEPATLAIVAREVLGLGAGVAVG
jgi:sugar phosphate isomerase/epimerase